jgi:glycosyltransferase involved in cell wall biosynthesis
MLYFYDGDRILSWLPLYQSPTSESLAFALLPVRSIIIFLQLIYHTYRINRVSSVPPLYFTVNAFSAWTGNVLRRLNLVRDTVYWVWDYYPPRHKSFMVRFMRWMYWLFDKPAGISSGRTVFINRRLITLRQKNGILPKNGVYPVVGMGTDPQPVRHPGISPLRLVFFGVLKKSQGLDIIFDYSDALVRRFRNIELHIIGGGPDESYYKKRASGSPISVRFHGYIPDDTDADKIMSGCHIGIAPYVPDPANVSYYTDPSKIKRYLSLGLPVITTDVFDFSRQIGNEKAGILFDYKKPDTFVNAVGKISADYSNYCRNAFNLAKKYRYDLIYGFLFGPYLSPEPK